MDTGEAVVRSTTHSGGCAYHSICVVKFYMDKWQAMMTSDKAQFFHLAGHHEVYNTSIVCRKYFVLLCESEHLGGRGDW